MCFGGKTKNLNSFLWEQRGKGILCVSAVKTKSLNCLGIKIKRKGYHMCFGGKNKKFKSFGNKNKEKRVFYASWRQKRKNSNRLGINVNRKEERVLCIICMPKLSICILTIAV
jgi:hypothetical protein